MCTIASGTSPIGSYHLEEVMEMDFTLVIMVCSILNVLIGFINLKRGS